MKSQTITCKACKAEMDELAAFPGTICLACHEKKFNAELARNHGVLPRPDFSKIFTRGTPCK